MSKNILRFEIEENKITTLSRNPLPTNSIDVSMAQFKFDDSWEKYAKVAVFKVYLPTGNITFEATIDEQTRDCIIPWEILQYPKQKLYCGVYGLLDGKRITTNYTVACLMVDGPEHAEESQPFTPSEYEDIMNRLHEVENAASRSLNYNDHFNKPSIEDVELVGNVTLDDIGAVYQKKYLTITELSKILV